MNEYTKYRLTLLVEDILRIIFVFVLQFIFLYFSHFFANNTMYFFFLGSIVIGGLYFILASLAMIWGETGDKRDAFFTFIIGVACIVGVFTIPHLFL